MNGDALDHITGVAFSSMASESELVRRVKRR